MSISVTDNVMTLLASLGFDDGRLGNQVEVVIDKFDQWTNMSTQEVLSTTTFPCFWPGTDGEIAS